MAERSIRRWFELLRWVSLIAAVVVLVVFLVAQRQSIDVSYGRSPASSNDMAEGAAGELSDATVPSVREMTKLVRADDVVRLPGSVASWDESRVREVIGDSEIRILVAPPGLEADERERIRAVEGATIRVIGTKVTGGMYGVVGDSLAEWRAQFATGDVTDHLLALIATLRDESSPPGVDQFRWRDPSDAEIAAVATDLRASGVHIADGATLTKVPAAAATAFPDQDALYVALAQQPFGEPVPRYGPALVTLFPDTPIVVLYGSWIEYHGPHEEAFADVVGATFYGQLGDRLSRYSYPQDNVLFGYLNRVTDVRYAGLFDRPLPYQPTDPLRVALPALPWLFAGCVVLFLALSVRSLRQPAAGPVRARSSSRRIGMSARLAGLTALAIEVSGLTGVKSDAALTRGITKLRAARDALDENLPGRHVRALLNDAEAELDDVARALGRVDYSPAVYLRGRLA